MMNNGNEIRHIKERLDGFPKMSTIDGSLTSGVKTGVVIGYGQLDTDHWHLKVIPYAPETITTNGAVQFDDGSRDITTNDADQFVRVFVVNVQDDERVKALYQVGQVVTFWTGAFLTDQHAYGVFVTIHPTARFKAIVSPKDGDTYPFTAGYILPSTTPASSWTAVAFEGEAIPVNALGTKGIDYCWPRADTVVEIEPVWDDHNSGYKFYFTQHTDTLYVHVTGDEDAVNGAIRWRYPAEIGFWDMSTDAANGGTWTPWTAPYSVYVWNASEDKNTFSGVGTIGTGSTAVDSESGAIGGCHLLPIPNGAYVPCIVRGFDSDGNLHLTTHAPNSTQ